MANLLAFMVFLLIGWQEPMLAGFTIFMIGLFKVLFIYYQNIRFKS